MTTEPQHSGTPRTPKNIALQFLLGIVFGLLLIGTPLSYFWFFAPGSLHAFHLIFSGGFVLLCGICSGIFGGKFVELLSKLLEAFPSA